MTSEYTSAQLITNIKLRGMIPSSQNTFSTEEFLSIADDEIRSNLAPYVNSTREEYFVFAQEVPLESGRAEYRIPSRAMGAKLRSLSLKDKSNLPRFNPADVSPSTRTGQPEGHYLKANSVVLFPTPGDSSDTLLMHYYLRPNRLVLPAEVGVVTEVVNDETGYFVTVSDAPTSFSTSQPFDLIRGTPGFECTAIDLTPNSISDLGGSTYRFEFDAPSPGLALVVGDYVCRAGESPVPQIPADLYPILAQRVVVKILEALGDSNLDRALRDLKSMEARCLDLISSRVEASPKKIVPARRRFI